MEGTIDPEFRSERNDRTNDVSSSPTTQPARFRFSIASILVATLIVGVALVCWKASPSVFWTSLAATIAANLMGLIAAWFVTNIFRLPNDGSFSWDDDDENSAT